MKTFTAARGSSREFGGIVAREELAVGVGEHRVVERVLRVEVLVQGRLADAYRAGQRVK